MARLFSRRTTQLLLVLLGLFLGGTVVFLYAVNAYFSIDASAIIQPEELGSWEEISWSGDVNQLPWSWRSKYPWLSKALNLRPSPTSTSSMSQDSSDKPSRVIAAPISEESRRLSEAIAKAQEEAARAAGWGDAEGQIFKPPGRDNSVKAWDPKDPPEKIPRIIHQTWKDNILPPVWQAVRDECAQMHPDYEYMLWTDADSRKFLVEHYPWFVPIFDAYPYPIQRADAIRYFILHHFGGIYMDLDVGCLRRFDPLLRFEVVLPKTIPVGVSNDVMLAAKGHPFMDHLIHNLVTFNHRYLTHYPTVMFSTGPMFVSASYGLYVDAHGQSMPSTSSNPAAGFSGIRVLPKPLYGKNAKPSEAPDAFFRHFYGSSWHANDADFLIFLRDHGRFLMFLGGCIVIYGLGRSLLPRLLGQVSLRVDGRRRSNIASGRRGGGGRWIQLPLSDPDARKLRKSLSNSKGSEKPNTRRKHSGTQTISAAAAAEAMASGSGSSTVRVAAPRPQRVSMPMFDLREGGGGEVGSEEEDDLGPGLNAEQGSVPESSGLLAWVRDGLARSRPSSSEGGLSETEVAEAADLARSGSASKYKARSKSFINFGGSGARGSSARGAGGMLYLPAYFVGDRGNSTGDSSSSVTSRTDDGTMASPTSSSVSSTPNSAWLGSTTATSSFTAPHSRTNSLGNWAASFFPTNGAIANTIRAASPSLQGMMATVGAGGRTPSPSRQFDVETGSEILPHLQRAARQHQHGGSSSSSSMGFSGSGLNMSSSTDSSEMEPLGSVEIHSPPSPPPAGAGRFAGTWTSQQQPGRFAEGEKGPASTEASTSSRLQIGATPGSDDLPGASTTRSNANRLVRRTSATNLGATVAGNEGDINVNNANVTNAGEDSPPPPYQQAMQAQQQQQERSEDDSLTSGTGSANDDKTPTLAARRFTGR